MIQWAMDPHGGHGDRSGASSCNDPREAWVFGGGDEEKPVCAMSTLRDIQAETRAEWSRLQACWDETRSQWQDDVADEFERHRWRAWEEQMPAFLDALEKLEEIASRALRET
jgi:hypothetical protein